MAKNKQKKETLSVFVALDRSGSMAGPSWDNGIEALNSYVAGLKEADIEGDITVVAFDTHRDVSGKSTVDLVDLANNADISTFQPLTSSVLQPRGMTPLFDAAATVMHRAIGRNNKKTVVIIITDGHENSSVEYTQARVKDMVELITKKGWEVVFLGANFDVKSYTTASGLDVSKSMSFDSTSRGATQTMTGFVTANTIGYMAGAAFDFTIKGNIKK